MLFLVQVNFLIPLKDDKNRELELGEFFLCLNKLTFLLPVIIDILTQSGICLKSPGAQYIGYEIELYYYYYYLLFISLVDKQKLTYFMSFHDRMSQDLQMNPFFF